MTCYDVCGLLIFILHVGGTTSQHGAAMERPPFRRALQLPRAPPLRRALPLRRLCLLCLLPLASGLLDLYDDTFEERIEAEPVLLILLYQPCSKTHCNNDGPCEDLPPSQNDLFAPVFEAAAAELGDEIPLARINGNLVERAVQQYGSQEMLYYGAVGVAPRRTRGLLGTCSPELVVFRHGRDYRFRGPGLPTQPELVSYMRTEAELARRAAPSTMQLAWHGLADEISRLNPAGETEIPRFDRTIDTLGMDSAGRLLKISERPDGRRKTVLPNPGYHERNWVAASLPLHGALTEEALRETHLAHFVGASRGAAAHQDANPNPGPKPNPEPKPSHPLSLALTLITLALTLTLIALPLNPDQARRSTPRCSLRASCAYRRTPSSLSTSFTSASARGASTPTLCGR